jgi:hypothetical protein
MSFQFSGIDHIPLAAPEDLRGGGAGFFCLRVRLAGNPEAGKLAKAWRRLVSERQPSGALRRSGVST